MSGAREVNFDGLVGPTHNYGGLSLGNVASMASQEKTSNPREAALQGLAKMRMLVRRGFTQGFLPPHERPHLGMLRRFGFDGSDQDILAKAARDAPLLLKNCSSASAMWTANAATVTPSTDSRDGRLHATAANLGSMFHRSLEHPFTTKVLSAAFHGDLFRMHDAVPFGGAMGDEGAANHGRLAAEHGAPGLHLYVYGRSAFERQAETRFPARQALEASRAVADQHGVPDAQRLFIKQNPAAIDAGAFHNDVVSVANGPVLLYHEKAFADRKSVVDAIKTKADALGFEPILIEVPSSEVSLHDAVTSYLFNSQLLTRDDGAMVLLLPSEAEQNAATRRWCEKVISGDNPIRETIFADLRQSMRNGGGPACLRLRVVMSDAERSAMRPGFLLDEQRITKLEEWVRRYYRDRLEARDIADPQLLDETRQGLDRLTQFLEVGDL
ncbi:MAG: N-succinylarginine dihydrolase, partial [Pseudomonadota bacterium]